MPKYNGPRYMTQGVIAGRLSMEFFLVAAMGSTVRGQVLNIELVESQFKT